MSIILSGDMSESEYATFQELENLRALVREYLSYGSCDGKVERKDLRKQLAIMVNCDYDDREAKITKNYAKESK